MLFWVLFKNGQIQGAHKHTTGAYMEIREDRGFVGNAVDGRFSTAP